MENLNAEEIKCGLEHCTAKSYKCEECPYFYKSEGLKSSMEILMTDALALINSQEQRIKELTEENEGWTSSIKILVNNNADLEFELAQTYDLLEESKVDTVREMQERLKEHLEKPEFPWDSFTVAEEVIDQIAKEMLEGEK